MAHNREMARLIIGEELFETVDKLPFRTEAWSDSFKEFGNICRKSYENEDFEIDVHHYEGEEREEWIIESKKPLTVRRVKELTKADDEEIKSYKKSEDAYYDMTEAINDDEIVNCWFMISLLAKRYDEKFGRYNLVATERMTYELLRGAVQMKDGIEREYFREDLNELDKRAIAEVK